MALVPPIYPDGSANADVLVKGVDEPNSCIIVEFGKRMRLLNFVVIFDPNLTPTQMSLITRI